MIIVDPYVQLINELIGKNVSILSDYEQELRELERIKREIDGD